MLKIDWGAVRAYASPLILTLVALLALWKDAKDYKELAKEETGDRTVRWVKQHTVSLLAGIAVITLLMSLLDIHSTRHQTWQDKADAQADKATRDKEIGDLRAAVNSGNELLGLQRKDFLDQFSQMSNRVTMLQTEVKTSDLKEEASQLRSELESTRKSLQVPKATLSFSFWEDSGQNSNLASLNLENGAAKIKFDVVNGSDADALEGAIVFQACGGCKIIGTSPGFVKMDGQPDTERNWEFEHIFANSRAPRLEVTILPPHNVNSFQIAIKYRCRTCLLVRSGQPLPANDVGTVLIGPHWKPSLLQLNKVASPKD